MATLLIVLSCVLAHTVAASGTRYIVERVMQPDRYGGGLATAGCALIWPVMLIFVAVSWGTRLANGHQESAQARLKEIAVNLTAQNADLRRQLAIASQRPPAQGVHR